MRPEFKNIFFTPFFVLLAFIAAACGAEVEAEEKGIQQVEVKVGAVFAPVTYASFYDEAGEMVAEATAPNLSVMLNPGTYYVDIRDDYGNGVFSDDERFLFTPSITSAEVDIAPYHVPNQYGHMIRILVDAPDNFADDVSVKEQALHTFGSVASMRARLVWEGAYALVGSDCSGGQTCANNHTWNTSVTQYGDFNYAASDTGAWSSLRSATVKDGVIAWYLTCRKDNDTSNNYTPCSLTYGSDNPSQYGYQGSKYKGGQCKPFTNLIAYRSGVYHGASWSFVNLPSDGDTAAPQDPLSTTATVQAGDVLRRPSGHAVIAVRVTGNAANDVVIIDSNWSGGGDGNENISSHVMNYSGSNNDNLGNYNTYNCIYTSTTSDGC